MRVLLAHAPDAVPHARRRVLVGACAWLLSSLVAPAHAQLAHDDAVAQSLAELSLEELMAVEVEIVAGRPQSRAATPAALTVLSAEDIRRSGHRTLVEALRLVPGMYVGRVSSASWVAGARGLTGSLLTATRYLVLVDGRVVYDPLFSGTFWDVVDVPVADIERIEVIRGPGATLWGVNAMNGVVNVVTRHAQATLGTLVELGAGTLQQASAYVRQGGETAAGAYRVWAKYDRFDAFDALGGGTLQDQWSRLRTGFRLDWKPDAASEWRVEGDLYTHPTAWASVRLPVAGQHQQFVQVNGDQSVGGAHLSARLQRNRDADAGWSVRAYLDHTHRDTLRFGVRRETLDLDYRRWLRWAGHQELVWGGQVNWTADRVEQGDGLLFSPDRLSWTTSNLFVQNTSELVPGSVHAMVGSKLTHHQFVGWALQPGARLWWTPDERQTLWAAVSRPVRVPSRLERDGLLVFSYGDTGLLAGGAPSGQIVALGLEGDRGLRAETLRAWELGHRIRFSEALALDTALFYNDYTRLIGVQPEIVGPFTDLGKARTWGGDLSVSARLTPRWRMEAALSTIDVRVDGPILDFEERSTPGWQAQLRSYLDIGDNLELNTAAYRVDAIPFHDVDAYTRLDLGVTWHARPWLRLSFWGQNLLESGHRENTGAGLVPRAFQVQASIDLGH